MEEFNIRVDITEGELVTSSKKFPIDSEKNDCLNKRAANLQLTFQQ